MSKLITFEFQCSVCNVISDDLVNSSVREIDCPKCGATAKRIISAPRIDKLRMAASGEGFGTANDYFAKVHRERKAIEDRKYATHGDYGTAAGSDGGLLTPKSQTD